MAEIKLARTAVDAANPRESDDELHKTTIPGFLVKVTPAGRKIVTIAYATNGPLWRDHRRTGSGVCRIIVSIAPPPAPARR